MCYKVIIFKVHMFLMDLGHDCKNKKSEIKTAKKK